MAKENNQETRTALDDVNDSLSRAELKVQDNKKVIMWVSVAVAALVAIVLIYIYLIRRPGVDNADKNVGLADNKALVYDYNSGMLSDSARAEALTDVVKSYEAAAENGYDGGNRAKLMTAVYAYEQGDYEKALSMLKDYDRTDNIIGATSKALEGDCYVNLDKYQEAIECYKEALKISEDNPMLAPYFLLKEATVQRELKNFAAEAEIYQTLLDKYPQYGEENGIDFEKYLARAKASK